MEEGFQITCVGKSLISSQAHHNRSPLSAAGQFFKASIYFYSVYFYSLRGGRIVKAAGRATTYVPVNMVNDQSRSAASIYGP